MKAAQFSLLLWSLLALLACTPQWTVPGPGTEPRNEPGSEPRNEPRTEPRSDGREPDFEDDPQTPQEARVEYADWLNIGGTDGVHPSGIAHHIREKGIRQTIIERASLTRQVLGEGARLGVWLPFGVNRDKYSGKIRYYYENLIDASWDADLVAGIRLARQRYGIEVVPYLGKISLATEAEFERASRLLASAGVTVVIIDNLSDTSDRAAPARIRRLRDEYGIESVGSEFPEKDPAMSDFGFAVDMTPAPGAGSARGATMAKQHGAMASGQPLAILLQSGWPEGMRARARYWQSVSDDLTLYANLNDEQTREVVEGLRK